MSISLKVVLFRSGDARAARMAEHLFPNFLKDSQEYRGAERFWEKIWQSLVDEAGVAEQWRHPWLGAPFRDGNPIFSAVSPGRRRGVSVIQHEATSSKV